MYLAGGPGTSSLDPMADFPCFFNADSNSTTLNPNSWNNNVNMLYIDQPVGTGFSYVDLANGTFNALTANFTMWDDEQDMPELNATLLPATFSRANSDDEDDKIGKATVPLTSMSSARTMWKFAQVWFQEFPERNTDNDEISLWSSSVSHRSQIPMPSLTHPVRWLLWASSHVLLLQAERPHRR